MFDFNALPRHPLHSSILECFLELRATPSNQNARFTATLTRVLLDSVVTRDTLDDAPSFLTDRGIRICRMDLDLFGDTVTGPDEFRFIDHVAQFQDKVFMSTTSAPQAEMVGSVMISEPLDTLGDIASLFATSRIEAVCFPDPIYEDSLIVVTMTPPAAARWCHRYQGVRDSLSAA